jgi:hypothetical protein
VILYIVSLIIIIFLVCLFLERSMDEDKKPKHGWLGYWIHTYI